MVVQHNMQAVNSNRMLGITTKTVASSTEKLSSGYAINRAADNAAGLAISEKMRKQIRGLTQASTNAEDGISSVQTAEGALAEIQDMLQRMNELCVQAANGTNSSTDRQYIQDEIDQLVKEVDRVAETTKFNETYLLKGDETEKTTRNYIVDYSTSPTPNIKSNADENKQALDTKVNYTGSNNIYVLSKDILTADVSNPISAETISKGNDITKYMIKDEFTTKAVGTTTDNELKVEYKDTSSKIVYDATGLNNIQDASNQPVSKIYVYDAASNTSVELTADNVNDFFERNNTGATVAKSGYAFYSANANPSGTQTESTRIDAQDVIDEVLKDVSNVLYSDNGCTQVVAAVDLKGYFKDDGTRDSSQNLYYLDDTGTPQEVGNTKTIDEFVKVTPKSTVTTLNPTGENAENAQFNVDKYAAFVAIELNSNVADGKNGKIASTLDNSPYDLSTDGITNTVKANKDLYVYTKETGTITHLAAGSDMTAYLNDDNTMKDEYVLVGVLDSKDGTSEAVKLQMLGAKDADNDGKADTFAGLDADGDGTAEGNLVNFRWDNKFIQKDVSKQKLYDATGTEVSSMRLNDYFDENGNYLGGLYTTPQARAIDQVFANTSSDEYKLLVSSGIQPAVIDSFITKSSTEVLGDLAFQLHVGADSAAKNKITVGITALTSAGMRIDKLSSDKIGIVDGTGQLATDAIDVVADAINQISRQRAALGAAQNRLEHTIKNLDNVVENTQSAESTIRDTDMATEMVKYSNANILQQAGQSMLAQSNQANQGVLSLLQ